MTELTVTEVARRLNLPPSRRGFRGVCPVCGNDACELRATPHGPRLRCYYGCQPAELARAATGGVQHSRTPLPSPSTADRTAGALAIWRGALNDHSSLAAYCAARGLPGLERSAALRWRPDVRHPESDGLHPAMIAEVVDVAGRPIAVHRTYTRRDGRAKADLSPTKASKGPIAGGAIRLDPGGPELVIGEGIETSAAAGRMLNLPAWAAVAAGNLERNLALPFDVRRVVIASDDDPAGQRAADGAARRWRGEGRHVRIIIPDGPGDFADMWARRSGARG